MRFPISAALLLAWLAGPAHAAGGPPEILPLGSDDLPRTCGCSFGAKKGQPLLFWSWEEDKAYALMREREGGLRKLRLYSEKYFPAQHEPPRAGDRMTLLFSWSDWNVQTASEVSRACAPKAKRCHTTDYRSLIVMQWAGRHRREIRGQAQCGCPAAN